MNIVALYKTFDGGEFVDASLASIYEHCTAIVMVHSNVSWLGQWGNSVRDHAVKWCESHDHAGKVHHIDCELNSQEAQYALGLDYIAEHKLAYDAVMVVDADEVWEPQYIESAIRQMHDNPQPGYRANMHTYLKTPFFRVDPPKGSPVVFLRAPHHLTLSPRGHRVPEAGFLSDCWMHHYTYVRESRELVERKLHQSALADKSGEQVISNWMFTVYDRLPEGRNLHAFQKHRSMWARVQKIWLSDLPPAMQKARLLQHWFPRCDTMLDGELNCLHRLAKGAIQAVDLGTLHGQSAVALALACRRVHTVDCYDRIPRGTFADTLDPSRYEKFTGHSLQKTQALAKRWGNITAERGKTQDAGRRWSDGTVNVLLVDADHSEAGTLGDLEAWFPHLVSGSLVFFHDNNDIHPGVQSAMRLLQADPRLKSVYPGEHTGSLCVFEVV